MSTINDMKDYQTSSGSAYQVFPKLCSDDNYFSWCASMELVLRSLNQWDVVTGTFISPVCVVEKSPMANELQLEKAWELRKECAYTEIDLQVECHDLLISVDDHLTFSLYLPSLHLLILQAKYFIIHISSQAWPLSALAIGPSLYCHYLP